MSLRKSRSFGGQRGQSLLDKIHVEPLKSYSVKLTQVRRFWHVFALLICCYILLAFASNAAGARFSLPDWIELSPIDSPPARSYLAMTYDPTSGKVIAFGGFDGTGYLNDTWSFDGTSWTQIATQVSPPARTAAQMTYDSVSQKVVLFGGYDGANYLGDTWLWDGSTLQWTQATPQHHPPAVTGPMLFPDPNGRADVFGGFNGQFYQLTMWQWNGSDWTQLFPSTVPFARASAAVGTNTTTGQVVMFGGLASVNPNNTWTYDGTTWTEQSPAVQPLLVYGGSAAFDPGLQGVVLFGGASGGVAQNTTWLWDQVGATWTQLSPSQSPPAREGAGMTYDAALGRIILFGGQHNNVYVNDTWELVSTLTPTPTPSPTVTATPTATPSTTPRPSVTPRPRPMPHPRPTPFS
jgi:galactose oxidase-like protein